MSPPVADAPESPRERLRGLLVFLCTGLVYVPLSLWLGRTTVHHPQLGHAFVVLALASLLLLRSLGGPLAWRWDATTQGLLVGSYGLLAPAFLWRQPWFSLPAFLLALGSFLLFLLGPARRGTVLALMAAFAAFLGLTLFWPWFDWPLRSWSGRSAAWLLGWGGAPVELSFVRDPAGAHLLLWHAGRPFQVATECNGFGVISACLLLALLGSLARPRTWFDRVLALVAAGFIGFFANALRIVAIVALAPWAGTRYHLVHEAVGTIAFYAALGLVWWLAMPPRPVRPAAPSDPGS